MVLSHLCLLRHRGGYWDDAYSQHAVEFPDLEGAPLRKTRGLKLYPTLPKYMLFLVFYPSASWCFSAGVLRVK